jgi:histidinol-phosphate aminotransferase
MSQHPEPAAAVRAVPATTPFVAPEELARRVGRDSLVRIGANESAFGPSPRAIAAMQAAVPLISLYGDPESFELREALAAKHGCAIENIVVTAGVDELLGLICRSYGNPGDLVLMSHGSYATFAFHVIGHGLQLATVPPFADGGIDVEAMLAAARERLPGEPRQSERFVHRPRSGRAAARRIAGRHALRAR